MQCPPSKLLSSVKSTKTRTEAGRTAEEQAIAFLSQKGFHLLHRNYRIRQGEIDLIAKEGEVLCFIEVRSRSQAVFGSAIETISDKKKLRILRTAEHFLTYVWKRTHACRFDVVTIDGPDQEIALFRNAFSG